jgi:ATP-binding cassette subfamily C (CFTR/MRP) protein 1
MALTCPILMVCVYLIQKIYLQTSRQIRFLDLECKSPLFTNVTETIEGLSTIRAFGWEEQYTERNMSRLDTSQRPYYLMYCIQRWLNLVLQLLVGGVAVILIALALNLKGTSSANLLGASLTSIVSFNGSLAMLMMFWTQLETSLGAVARLKGFETFTECEDEPDETFAPSPDWPIEGSIEFQDVSAHYKNGTKALKNVSFNVMAGSKIGICGRTGRQVSLLLINTHAQSDSMYSGKSTLVSVLLRLLDLDSGTITVDGVDLKTVPRDLIRSRLTTVPQDPFLLTGSLRLNMNPSSTLSDETIIAVMVKVNLWGLLEIRGGLDSEMKDQPLSQGQRQILCLARVILNSTGKILILDEPTSNMDMATDQQIRELLRQEFPDHTTIIISHRVESIMNSDKICVMDDGQMVDFGSP